MHVGLIIYGSLNTVSGGYLYDRHLVEFLKDQGDRVQLISLPWRDYFRHLSDNASRSLYHRLTNLSVDVLLQDELNHPSLVWLNRRFKANRRYPIVSIVHHLRCSEQRSSWLNSLYREIEQSYLRSVDALIFNSQTTRDVVSGLGINLQQTPNIVAYPSGDRFKASISDAEIYERSKSSGQLRLLFLGNLIPRKGLHTLLQALKQLSPHSYELTIVGDPTIDPKYARHIQDQIAPLYSSFNIQMTGLLPDDQLANLLRSSHVLVVPSSYEGFGIVYLEGMSFGLPAIGTTRGAAWELIDQGENGYLIPPGDSNALAYILQELSSNRTLLHRLSLSARKRFLTNPTWDQTASNIRNFLCNLVKEYPRSR